MRFYRYTPALLTPSRLKEALIGRDQELKNINRILKKAASGGSLSHPLLVGPKGIGKTHVLQVIYHAVKGNIETTWFDRYDRYFVPVIFSEEEYVGNIEKLILLILRYLSQSETAQIPPIPKELIEPKILGRTEKELALSYVETFKERTGKLLLLLIDNVNDILETFTEEDQSLLRSILMTSNSVLMIGTAPTLFDSIVNHDRPLYNFFEIVWLKDLPFAQTKNLLSQFSKLEGRDDLLHKIEGSESKIRAIHELAGGNPRLTLSLFHIMAEGDVGSVEATFLRLLDELSPYFRERMKDLSEQQREIIDAMAIAEKLLTPTEIAARCHLPVNIVNAQLNRLEKLGCIKKLPKSREKRALYDITERLFSLWRQMRVEAGRRRLGFIVKFLEIWFTKDELIVHLDKTIGRIHKQLPFGRSRMAADLDRLWYIKEAIPEFRNRHEICVACERGDYQVVLGLADEASGTSEDKLKHASRSVCRGVAHLHLGKYDQAIEAFKEAIEIKPGNEGAWYNLGITYGRLKKYDQAIEAYEKALKIRPDNQAAWYNLGNAHYELKKYDQAIEDLKRALEFEPDDETAWANLGITYGQLEKYDQAIEAYKRALEIKPDMKEAWVNLGAAHYELKKYDQAIEAFRKTIETKPDDEGAWYNLGNAYYKVEEYDQAIEAYKEALEIKPQMQEGWVNLGVAHYELKKYDQAIEAFRKAIEIEPDMKEAWVNLGDVYHKLKKHEKAIEAYKKGIEIEPDDEASWSCFLDFYLRLLVEKAVKGRTGLTEEESRNLSKSFSRMPITDGLLGKYSGTFKDILKTGKIDAFRKAMEEIEHSDNPDLLQFLRPYKIVSEYFDKKDTQTIERLKPEERLVVEKILSIAEKRKK